MKKQRNNSAFTLIEMITVIAIIVILAGMSAMLLPGSDDRAKSELTRQAFGIIDSALEEYRDFHYSLNIDPAVLSDEKAFYESLKFPADCNRFTTAGVETQLAKVLNKTVVIVPGEQDPNYSGSQVLYFFLSQVPACRDILAQIPKQFLTIYDKSKNPATITVNGIVYPLYRFVDPWGTAVRYDYYVNVVEDASLPYANIPLVDDRTDTIRTFPIITSAGPDRLFGTGDDIKSR